MTVTTKTLHNHLVYYDSEKAWRWYEVIGPDVLKYNEHFMNPDLVSADLLRGTTLTKAVAGTAVSADVAGGVLLLTSGVGDGQGLQFQWGYSTDGESVKLNAAYPFYLGVRLALNDADKTGALVGLAITDTSALVGTSDGVFFRSAKDSALVYGVLVKDSVESATALGTLADDTYVVLEMNFDGTTLSYYLDGTLIGSVTSGDANFPDDEELRLTLAMLSGEGSANTVSVDWLRFFYIYA